MLTSRVTKRVDVPHEPGEWLEIRMLPGKKLEQAKDERELQVLAKLRAIGGDVLTALRGMDRAEAEAELTRDPLQEYDVDTLLRAGIVGWSYEDKFEPVKAEQLDGKTRRWAAGEILAFSQRADAKNS